MFYHWVIITKKIFVLNMRNIVEYLFWIKMISAVVSLILLVAVIRLIVVIDYFSDKRDYGVRILREETSEKKRSSKQWKEILSLVSTHKPEAWKDAVYKADEMIDEVLKAAGYLGTSLDERLMKVDVSQIPNIDEIRKVRKEFFLDIDDPLREVTLSETKALLRLYRDLLRGFGIIE